MRRTVRFLFVFLVVIMMPLLFGCARQKYKLNIDGDGFGSKKTTEHDVTLVNNVKTADIWILPQTDKNLKSSLWGTATVKNLKANEQRNITLSKTDEQEKYIIRVIDDEHAYYSAKDISLGDGYEIHFKTDGSKFDAVIEIINEKGDVLSTQAAFVGVLG